MGIDLSAVFMVAGMGIGGAILGHIVEALGNPNLKTWIDIATYLMVGLYGSVKLLEALKWAFHMFGL